MADLVERLRGANVDFQSRDEIYGLMREAAAEIESLRKQFFDSVTTILAKATETNKVIEMEAALAPFADLAKTWCCGERPDREVVTGAVIHAGDLERARQALEDYPR